MKRILLIDDEELVVKSISRLLVKHGYNVSISSDGQQGIEKAKTEDIDLIICDIRMPGTNGIEVIKEIRNYCKINKKKQIPEIIITGYADNETMKVAEDLRVADYLYKPFNLNDFLNCVQKYIEK